MKKSEVIAKISKILFASFYCGLSVVACIILKEAFSRDSLTFTIVNAIACFTFFFTFVVLDSIGGFISILLGASTVILSVLIFFWLF